VSAFSHEEGPAQEDDHEHEHFITVEIGGAGEWAFQGGSAYGPAAAVEFNVIQHWLEIETGVTPLFSNGQAENGTELLFKKPFELSQSLELLLGAGPEWVHRTGDEGPADSIAGIVSVTLVYEPWHNSPAGFFVEPEYSYDFRTHEQSFGVTAGLHIGIK
jgi:hypothetical protein